MSDTEKRDDKIQRILSIYTKLMNGQIVYKDEETLIHKCNARSFQRDIEDIREFLDNQNQETGVRSEVIYDSKVNGYRIKQNAGNYLNNYEVLAICKILLDSRAFIKPEMESMIHRLIGCCVPKQEQKEIKDLISNEMYHYVELQHKQSFLKNMWEIGKAIGAHKYIEIDYLKNQDNSVVQRKLKPVAIMFSEFYFYLAAFIDDESITEKFDVINDSYPTIYRIDRIRNLRIIDEHFQIPYNDRFEEGEFRKRIQFMYGGKLQRIMFRYTGSNVEAVLDRLPTAKIVSHDGDEYVLTAEVFGKGIEMWIRSQGDTIKVIQN